MSQVLELNPSAARHETEESHLAFSNPGVLDINLVKLLGVSVKEGDSPIGFFGTGLKYAMATALRLGGSMTIYADGEPYEVNGRSITLRERQFSQVFLNDEALGFTTELGKQWEAWMVVRELYSNALDEQGQTGVISGEVNESALGGRTVIVLRGKAFLDVWNERGRYFIAADDKPLHRSESANAHDAQGQNRSVFYRGIKVLQTTKPTLYRYNILDTIKLTEDRTILYSWQFNEAIEKSIITSGDAGYIARLLTAGNDYHESGLGFSEPYAGLTPSDEFKSVCRKLNERRPQGLNMAAMRWFVARTQSMQPRVPATLTKVQKIQLDRAVAFVGRISLCGDFGDYPIEVVNWLGEGVYGQALDGRIIIARDCFDKGTKFLASTIFEEFVHCHYGYADETREMQTWLFDRIVTMGEEHVTGEPL